MGGAGVLRQCWRSDTSSDGEVKLLGVPPEPLLPRARGSTTDSSPGVVMATSHTMTHCVSWIKQYVSTLFGHDGVRSLCLPDFVIIGVALFDGASGNRCETGV